MKINSNLIASSSRSKSPIISPMREKKNTLYLTEIFPGKYRELHSFRISIADKKKSVSFSVWSNGRMSTKKRGGRKKGKVNKDGFHFKDPPRLRLSISLAGIFFSEHTQIHKLNGNGCVLKRLNTNRTKIYIFFIWLLYIFFICFRFT